MPKYMVAAKSETKANNHAYKSEIALVLSNSCLSLVSMFSLFIQNAPTRRQRVMGRWQLTTRVLANR
jgi:hypothetical protein